MAVICNLDCTIDESSKCFHCCIHCSNNECESRCPRADLCNGFDAEFKEKYIFDNCEYAEEE